MQFESDNSYNSSRIIGAGSNDQYLLNKYRHKPTILDHIKNLMLLEPVQQGKKCIQEYVTQQVYVQSNFAWKLLQVPNNDLQARGQRQTSYLVPT